MKKVWKLFLYYKCIVERVVNLLVLFTNFIQQTYTKDYSNLGKYINSYYLVWKYINKYYEYFLKITIFGNIWIFGFEHKNKIHFFLNKTENTVCTSDIFDTRIWYLYFDYTTAIESYKHKNSNGYCNQ